MVFDGGVMIVLLPMTAAHQYTLTSWTLWSAGLPDKECRGQTMKGDLYAFHENTRGNSYWRRHSLSSSVNAGEQGKWHATAAAVATSTKSITIPDKKDHFVYLGEFDGVVFTDGGGFLNNARYQIADVQDSAAAIVPGGETGYKIFTATDGGQVFGKYQATEAAPPIYKGTWQFTGGTGKYQGIKGHGTWTYHSMTDTTGYDFLEGEYELP